MHLAAFLTFLADACPIEVTLLKLGWRKSGRESWCQRSTRTKKVECQSGDLVLVRAGLIFRRCSGRTRTMTHSLRTSFG